MTFVIDRYDEVFEIEIDGWCFGLSNYGGEVTPEIVHRVIRELASAFQAAIEHNVAFNIEGISLKFSQAARFMVHPKEIAFAIISQLPNPAILEVDQQGVLAEVIDQIDRVYEGALESFYKRWHLGPKKRAA